MQKISKLSKLTFILLMLISLCMSQMNLSANEESLKEGLNIKQRLNNLDFNLLDSGKISFQDQNGNAILSNNPATINDCGHLSLNWSLTNKDREHILSNDYFEFTLPSELIIENKAEVNLGIFAKAIIDTNNKVRIIFLDQIRLHSNIKGQLTIPFKLNPAKIIQPTTISLDLKLDQPLKFDVKRIVPLDSVEIKADLYRDGLKIEQYNPDMIIWEIIVNQDYKTHSDFNISTDFGDLSLDYDNAVEVYPVNYDMSNNFINYDQQLSKENYKVTNDKITFIKEVSQPYAIKYITHISEDDVNNGDNYDEKILDEAYKVEVTVNSDKIKEKSTLHRISASFNKLLDLNVVDTDNSTSANWQINYNFYGKQLHNTSLEINLSDSLFFDETSLEIKGLDNDNKYVEYTVETDNNSFNINFENVIQPLIINFTTNIDAKNNAEEQQTTTVITKFDENYIYDSKNIEVHNSYLGLNDFDIDYKDKTVNWQIDINKSKNHMDNLIVLNNIKMCEDNLNLEADLSILDLSSKKTLIANTDYKTKIIDSNTLKIEFLNAYKQLDTDLRVNLKSNYSFKDFGVNDKTFKNQVDISFINAQNSYQEVKKEFSTNNVIKDVIDNGRMQSRYNYLNKEITWTANINFNQINSEKIVVENHIEAPQSLIVDSIKLFKYQIKSNGDIIVDKNNLFTLDMLEKKDNVFKISLLNPKNHGYTLTYKTSLEDQIIKKTYLNNLKYSLIAKKVSNNQQYILESTVDTGFDKQFLSLKYQQANNLIKWSVLINPSQSLINEVNLVGKSNNNHSLLPETFNIYPILLDIDRDNFKVDSSKDFIIDRDNQLKRDKDYTLSFNPKEFENADQFEINFKDQVRTTYVLKYQSQLIKPNLLVKNELTLNDLALETIEKSFDFKPFNINNGFSGSGSGSLGNYKLIKEDKYLNPLEGVIFELYDQKNKLIKVTETDAAGQIRFDDLYYGKYTLKEVKALSGFVIADDLYAGREIVVDDESSKPETLNKIINLKNKLSIYNKNNNQESLLNAIFKLEKLENNQYEIIENEIIIDDEKKVIKGLKAGNYRIQQVKAPTNYKLNPNPLKFTIDLNTNFQEVDKEITFINEVEKASDSLEKTPSVSDKSNQHENIALKPTPRLPIKASQNLPPNSEVCNPFKHEKPTQENHEVVKTGVQDNSLTLKLLIISLTIYLTYILAKRRKIRL